MYVVGHCSKPPLPTYDFPNYEEEERGGKKKQDLWEDSGTAPWKRKTGKKIALV